WEKLHRLALKTGSVEEKQYLYDALAQAIDPRLIGRTIPIALGEEMTTSRAAFLLPFIARYGERPELVGDFSRAHMKELLAKQDSLGSNGFASGLFTFSSDLKDAETLQAYAKGNLPPAAANDVAKAVDEIHFRAEFKQRLAPQLTSWIESGSR